jgi:hypothetical protein
MNIIEMHETTRNLMDQVGSPRFTYDQYDTAIKNATDDIIADKVGNLKKRKPYSFQSIQQIRDELYTLVKNVNMPMASNLLPVASLNALGDYRFALLPRVTISGVQYYCEPLSFDELPVIERDPYKRPKLTEPYKIYYIENNTGITINPGPTGTCSNMNLDYIGKPADVFHGILWGPGHNFIVGDVVLAVEETVYNLLTYYPGQAITIVGAALAITTGLVAISYVNSPMPEVTHKEICMKACTYLGMPVEMYQRVQATEMARNQQ